MSSKKGGSSGIKKYLPFPEKESCRALDNISGLLLTIRISFNSSSGLVLVVSRFQLGVPRQLLLQSGVSDISLSLSSVSVYAFLIMSLATPKIIT